MNVLNNILNNIFNNKKQLAVLIDPEKIRLEDVKGFVKKVNQSVANYIFVGGSTVPVDVTEPLVLEIKRYTNLPVVLFPGDVVQITDKANSLLFLSLLSGRNPAYLIGKHVEAIPRLKETSLEIIPTGYLLIENGETTMVQKVTETEPMSSKHIENIVNTALAGELLGMRLVYLEAGSGAKSPVSPEIIKAVSNDLSVPLIVGGGIKTKAQMQLAFDAGANLVVIGTALEKNEALFNELKRW
ncbi:geranylgeranylglyceryl/heptaprenylglyceryl phosphate synthase [Formosa algae]|uniref:Geranylgeranylglyceryl phosphate synthase n=1 Tax=Formosa algae TaxID=225843 RepID=A0A9X0YII1_9FLAO|nr:geranylgeranylglyceryl/heptaprenylglyceryl phosphate synthase [Formosa algae]MBP1839332.1 putative glycerol-1-phosphate prenyltransferase [Formosa algae]MDQ0334109.1 putative glycerol-1-phosphate prenyltransferase [Formosa algae]OEI79434.1 geranylgeranylglyceryl/heptaprenylglyceryl phosphate synthase [Formosa algae]